MIDAGSVASLKDWLAIISTAGFILTGLALNWLRTQFVPKADYLKLCEQMGALATTEAVNPLLHKLDLVEDRVTRIELDMRHLPDKDTAHRMEIAISRLEGRLETMDERLKPVAAMAVRMQDWVMDETRK